LGSAIFKQLQEADWAAIAVQLTAHAAFRAENLAWRTGNSLDLAKGLNPKDLAAEAIRKVIDGIRKWDPERGALLPFLKGVVDSEISHLAESSDNQLQARVLADDEEDEMWDRSEFQAPSNDPHGLLHQRQSTPEQVLLENEADVRISALFDAVAGQEDLVGVVDAIMEVGPRPADIAEHLGLPVSEINNRLKRLRRLALNLVTKQQDEAS
jgi:DNA-directed RNA polymerase specialized sigma24 family protein